MMIFVKLIDSEHEAPPGTGIYNPSIECAIPGLLCCQYTDDDDNAPLPERCIYAARWDGVGEPEVLMAMQDGYVVKQPATEQGEMTP